METNGFVFVTILTLLGICLLIVIAVYDFFSICCSYFEDTAENPLTKVILRLKKYVSSIHPISGETLCFFVYSNESFYIFLSTNNDLYVLH